jgi:hypothetical protein
MLTSLVRNQFAYPLSLKLVAAKGEPWELYDLRTDRAEQHNLAAKMPDKVKELELCWQKQVDSYTELAGKTLPKTKQKQKKQ